VTCREAVLGVGHWLAQHTDASSSPSRLLQVLGRQCHMVVSALCRVRQCTHGGQPIGMSVQRKGDACTEECRDSTQVH
jgi:uncharacterized membrane protein YccC